MHAAAVRNIGRMIAIAWLAGAAPGLADSAPVAVDPGARWLEGDGAGEAWDVSARLDDGSHFFVRFWITNEGPGAQTGIAMGYFRRPDGQVAQFRYGRERQRWESGAGGRFLKIASAVLDLRAPYGAVEIDTNRGGMKIYLRFAVPETLPAVCARRDGASGFDVLRMQEPVEGVAWVAGMTSLMAAKGAVDVTHVWSADSEVDTLLRRIDVSGRDGDVAFFATTVTARDGAAGSSCVAVARSGAPIAETRVAAEVVIGQPTGGADRYPLPSRISFRDPQFELTAAPRRELLRVDPLEIVPQPFRALLALRSAPQRIWVEADWQLRLEPGGIDKRGAGSAAITYTNPP